MRQDGQQLLYQLSHMTEDRETVLPSVRSGHSEQFIILSSYAEKKSSYRDFQISCVRNMLALTGRQEWCQLGTPPNTATNVR